MSTRDRYRRLGALAASALLVISACSDWTQAEPAQGPPTKVTPNPIDDLVVVQGTTLTDNNEAVSACVQLYLWSSTGSISEWEIYAVDDLLVDPEGTTRDGHEAICAVGETPGPFVFELPAGNMVYGWYTACTSGCSAPFEHPYVATG